MSQWVNGSVDGSVGRMGKWVNGSWVSDTMGQKGHGSPMVTHGPPWNVSGRVEIIGTQILKD